jgi:glycosyltransferase involved in cell wall biosynthesis
MKITGFLQVRNELITGHLERFLEFNSELFDYLVAFDDASTDGTADFLKDHVDLLLTSEFCSFTSELANKQKLLSEAKERFPDTDWFLWLDADEVLFTSRSELNLLISQAEEGGFSGISFPLTNLWKSEFFYRTDSGYDSLTNVRLWRNAPDLAFTPESGLHRLLHPTGVKRVLKQNRFHVTHFGFATRSLIARKFAYYRSVGQQGLNLWRLIDESSMNLKHIADRLPLLGSRFEKYVTGEKQDSVPPESESFGDYLALADSLQISDSHQNPHVTIVCLIYSGVDWLEFQYSELLALKRELGPGEVEILFVANDANEDVLSFLKGNNIPFVVAPGRVSAEEWYINSVYRAYNFGATCARGRYLLFVNSDMAYAPGFLHAILRYAAPEDYVSGKLIESGRLKPAEIAVKKNFGKRLKSFRRKAFYNYARRVADSTFQIGGLYMPAVVSKEFFLAAGGYPEGNISIESTANYIDGKSYSLAHIGDRLVSGDDAFVRKFLRHGGRHITVNSALVYHFQEGEKSTSSKSSNRSVASGVGVLNDQLIGINGEQTLWNYLIQDLESRGINVRPVPLGVNQKIPYRVSRGGLWRHPMPRMVFRNASFLRRIRGPWNQVVLLQDKVQSPKIVASQKLALKDANALVTNSWELFNSQFLSLNKRSYVLSLPVHPAWEGGLLNDPTAKDVDAIFVGAFNDTKGWNEVRELVYKFPETKFLLVSKYQNDEPNFKDFLQPDNVQILRCLSTEELMSNVERCRIFIVGSPFETQCLAAMEAAFRDLVICMKPTGVLAQLPLELRNQIGEFDTDLSIAFETVLERLSSGSTAFSPAETMIRAGLGGVYLREQWMNLLLDELENTFTLTLTPTLTRKFKDLIPLRYKTLFRKLIS